MRRQLGVALLFILLGPTGAVAADIAVGKQLVDENCYACHGTEVYTRSNRMISSRAGLSKQVQRCELSLGLTWFDDEIESVAEYLNQQFYHFK